MINAAVGWHESSPPRVLLQKCDALHKLSHFSSTLSQFDCHSFCHKLGFHNCILSCRVFTFCSIISICHVDPTHSQNKSAIWFPELSFSSESARRDVLSFRDLPPPSRSKSVSPQPALNLGFYDKRGAERAPIGGRAALLRQLSLDARNHRDSNLSQEFVKI